MLFKAPMTVAEADLGFARGVTKATQNAINCEIEGDPVGTTYAIMIRSAGQGEISQVAIERTLPCGAKSLVCGRWYQV